MKKRLSQFQRIADFAVVQPDGRYYVFGRGLHDAVVVLGTHHVKCRDAKFLKLNSAVKSLNDQGRNELLSSVRRFSRLDAGDQLSTFSILSDDQRAIRDAIAETSASHVQFEFDGVTAKAYVFHVASLDGEVLWRSTFTARAVGIDLSNAGGLTSSFVMKSQTFMKLPNEPYSVSLYEDYAVFASSRDATLLYLRDQDIRRPYTNVFSDRLGTSITFLFHSMS